MSDHGATIRRRRLWERPAAVKAYALARSAAERVGLQVVLKTYYSPIPDLATVPADVWDKPDAMRGIEFDLDAQVKLLEGQLGEELRAFAPDEAIPSRIRYDPANPSYPPPDARLLYALIRHCKPSAIVELGSGQSSRVVAQACRVNAAEGRRPSYRVFDPFAADDISELPCVSEVARIGARTVSDQIFDSLGEGDMLLVDTTHTVKLGGEVNRLILQVLPVLAPGVLVHFHDIHLPYQYPRYLAEDYGLYWTEQYLLQAFLAMNDSFEILFAVNALCRDRADTMAPTGLARPGEVGGAFWIQRKREVSGMTPG